MHPSIHCGNDIYVINFESLTKILRGDLSALSASSSRSDQPAPLSSVKNKSLRHENNSARSRFQ